MSRIKTRRERRQDERDRERWLDEEARERRHQEMMKALESQRDRRHNVRDPHLSRPPQRHVVRSSKPPRPTTQEERDQLLGCLAAPFVILWFGARELARTLDKQKERAEYLRRTPRLQTFLAHSRTGTVSSASETERMAYLYLLALYHVRDYEMRDRNTNHVEHRLQRVVEWPGEASHRSRQWLMGHLRAFQKVDTKTWFLDWSDIHSPIPELPDDPAAAGEAVKLFIRQLSPSAKRR